MPQERPFLEQHHGGHLTTMTKELDLTAEQQNKVRGIFEEQSTKFKAIHEETKQRLQAILTPEQQKKFADMHFHRPGTPMEMNPHQLPSPSSPFKQEENPSSPHS